MNPFRRRPEAPPAPLPGDPSCEQVGRVLQAYVDGELGPHDAERVAAHLVHCDRCEIEREVIDEVVHAIQRQQPDLDPLVLDRLTAFVDGLGSDG